MWKNDPFKRFLRIYGALVVLGLTTLIGAKQEINYWFFETSAFPLLETELTYIEEIWYDEGEHAVKEEIADQQNSMFRYEFKEIISDSKYRVLENELNEEAELDESQLDTLPAPSFQLTNEVFDEEPDQQYATLVTYLPKGDHWQSLHISINLDNFEGLFFTFNLLMFIVAGILLSGFVIAFVMVRNLKARLTEINKASEDIQLTNNLSQRISVGNLNGPLADTINQINRMLDSIETNVISTKQQADNIAHDLRTPLTSMYNKIQKVSHRYPELIDIELMLEKLLSTFNLLLRINRLESTDNSISNIPTNMANVIHDVQELYEPVLEEKQQQINIVTSKDHIAIANSELLFQALCNLIDNASKFSPIGGHIKIETQQTGNELHLLVADQGGGVKEDNLDSLCKKFFQEDMSRNKDGNGLGLSFAAAAVHRMSGEIRLSNQTLNDSSGLVVSLIFKVD